MRYSSNCASVPTQPTILNRQVKATVQWKHFTHVLYATVNTTWVHTGLFKDHQSQLARRGRESMALRTLNCNVHTCLCRKQTLNSFRLIERCGVSVHTLAQSGIMHKTCGNHHLLLLHLHTYTHGMDRDIRLPHVLVKCNSWGNQSQQESIW